MGYQVFTGMTKKAYLKGTEQALERTTTTKNISQCRYPQMLYQWHSVRSIYFTRQQDKLDLISQGPPPISAGSFCRLLYALIQFIPSEIESIALVCHFAFIESIAALEFICE